MSISSYSELNTAVQKWVARSDTDFTDRFTDFLDLVESSINRTLYAGEGETASALNTVASTATVALPADCRLVRSLSVGSSPITRLEYMTPAELDRQYTGGGTGLPSAYTVIGTNIHLRPTPDAVYALNITYVTGVPALTVSNTTNNVLARHPDIYLHGVLYQAHGYLMDEARAGSHKALFDRALEEARIDYERSRYAGSPLTLRGRIEGRLP